MCRIFGFRSVLFSKVHSSLVSAENALMGQSRHHPDGWGLAYYIAETPHLVKSTNTAESDELFRHLSGIVTSQTVIAHIRKATHGKLTLLNTHPFQYGRWTFAHNGNITQFKENKRALIQAHISPELFPFCLGETDSEMIFHFLLSRLHTRIDLHDPFPDLSLVMKTTRLALEELGEIVGPLHVKDNGCAEENYLTFVLSNGSVMLALNGGLTLHYSTHKKLCPERETCKSFAPSCEALPGADGKVNHLIFSSEPLQGENIWTPMVPGELIGINHEMRLMKSIVPLNFVKTDLALA